MNSSLNIAICTGVFSWDIFSPDASLCSGRAKIKKRAKDNAYVYASTLERKEIMFLGCPTRFKSFYDVHPKSLHAIFGQQESLGATRF